MRREFPRKVRQAALDRAKGHCEKCSAVLKKREGEVDHILPDILGGEPVLANAMVLCRPCHVEKTGVDVRRARKADRQRDKDSGAYLPTARPLTSRGFPKRAERPDKLAPPPRRLLYARGELERPGIGDTE